LAPGVGIYHTLQGVSHQEVRANFSRAPKKRGCGDNRHAFLRGRPPQKKREGNTPPGGRNI